MINQLLVFIFLKHNITSLRFKIQEIVFFVCSNQIQLFRLKCVYFVHKNVTMQQVKNKLLLHT